MTTKEFLAHVFTNETFDLSASIKPDKDSSDSKTVNLRFHMAGITGKDLLEGFLKDARIAWQNGASGRKMFDKYENRQTVEVNAKAPGAKVKTREERIAEIEAILGDHDLAVMRVDNPELFAKIMGKVDKEVAEEEKTE